MTANDDYQDEMSDHGTTSADNGDADDVAVELLLSGVGSGNSDADLAEFLGELRQLGDGAAPAPNEDLAALLTNGLPAIRIAGRRSRRHKIAAGIVVGGIATFGVAGVAAANDGLPNGAQGVVSRVVNDLTPFHVDSTPTPPPPASTPARRPAVVPRLPPSVVAPPAGSDSVRPGSSAGPSADDDKLKPAPTPTSDTSETAGDSDDTTGPSGPNREPSDPAMTPRPSRTTGNGSDDGRADPSPTPSERSSDH
jgi:hypothetical protein